MVMQDGADRPYVSTTPPSRERKKALEANGAEIYEIEAHVPDWEVSSFKLKNVMAKKADG
jgi:hypothetical protein